MGPGALQAPRPGADTESQMRTIGFRTHILLVLAGAAGVLASLGRPWYGAAPRARPADDPLTGLYQGMQRWVTETAGTTGWSALGTSGAVLAAMSIVAAAAVLACSVPALQGLGRELLRYTALAAFAIAAWRLLDPPGANDARELRLGAFAGAGFALMLFTAATGVANAPLRRRVAASRYVAPPPPPPVQT